MHGYPTGSKPRPPHSSRDTSASSERNLSNEQWTKLVSFLNSQLVNNFSAKLDPSAVASMASFSGTMNFSVYFFSDYPVPTTAWVMDTGAPHHVCNSISLFHYSSVVSNCQVNLPTGKMFQLIE